MAKRRWGASGVAGFRPVPIPPKQREYISAQLRSFGVEEVSHEFIADLSFAVGKYLSGAAIREESKPGKVRANLQAAIDAALVLNERLNALDSNSRQLLAECDAELNELQGVRLAQIIRDLDEARNLAHQYPRRGRLPDHERLWFAVDVGQAVEKHLGIEATSTKNGPYESVLSIILEIATAKPAESVHDLACKAVKAMRLNAPGVYEHLPGKAE